MRTLHPSRSFYAVIGIGTLLLFLVAAAAIHAIIGDALGCQMKGFVGWITCLFIPDQDDLGIHLLSYALASPLLVGTILWFRAWRRQLVGMNKLSQSLDSVAVRDNRLEDVASRLGLGERVRLLNFDDDICFCACFASCRIYVSRSLVEKLTADELEALLLHEKYHLENHDSLKMLLGHATVSFMFFTPVLKDLFKRYLVGKEIAADQKAIEYQGHHLALASILRKMLAEPAAGVALLPGSADSLESRVRYFTGHPFGEKIPAWHLALSLAIPAAAVAGIIGPFVIGLHL